MQPRSTLLNKDFVLLWQGQFISQMGTQAFMIAMLLWLQETTSSATLVGLLMALATAPGVILGPFAGTLADLFSRRNLIVGSDLVSGAVTLLLAYLFYSVSPGQPVAVLGLCAAALVVGIGAAVFQPALAAAIPDLVPGRRISAANSLVQGSIQLATLVAQGVGGVLYRVIGANLLILVNGVTYLFSAFSEMFITIPQGSAEPPAREEGDLGATPPTAKGFLSQVGDGFRYVWRIVGLRLLFFAVTAVRFFVVPFTVLLPFYVSDFLNAPPDWFGYLVAGFGVGVMIGYVLSGSLSVSGSVRSRSVLLSIVVMSACLGALGLTSEPFVALGLFVVAGVMNGFMSVQMITVLQVTTAQSMRGRVFGLARTVGEGLTPAAMLLSGIVADLAGRRIQAIYLGCGVILMVLAVVLGARPELRRFLAVEVPPEDEGEEPAVSPDSDIP